MLTDYSKVRVVHVKENIGCELRTASARFSPLQREQQHSAQGQRDASSVERAHTHAKEVRREHDDHHSPAHIQDSVHDDVGAVEHKE
mmetsp:Transcript_5357/g.8839  ORF Transcript_5357/g.8839 Transcript_5357/m.8839 type:complete len:87 (-) Transcript_5357:385-645(-)